MSESRPVYEKPPTFEEVVLYANEQKLIGKVDIRKFYDWYDRSNFQYHGLPVDWKSKLLEWASRQNVKVTITGEVQAVLDTNKKQKGQIDVELLDRIARCIGYENFKAYLLFREHSLLRKEEMA